MGWAGKLFQDMIRWQAVMHNLMNIWVPYE